jgi:hypothetical protein
MSSEGFCALEKIVVICPQRAVLPYQPNSPQQTVMAFKKRINN